MCISKTVPFVKSVFILTISVTLLQFIPLACGNGNHVEWDLAVAHGSRVNLISRSTSSTLDLTMQMPIGSLTVSTQPDDNGKNDNRRMKQSAVSLAADPNRGLLFFSQTTNYLTSISVFNLEDNVTVNLYQKKNSTITGLVHHKDALYWSDNNNGQGNIMKLNTTVFTGITPEVLFSLNDTSIYGLAINPNTSVLYWASWSLDSKASGAINMYDGTTQLSSIVISNELYRPKGLFSDDTYLYWTDSRPSVTFTIERALLSNMSQREILKKGESQHPFSLTVACSNTLYWSDTMSRSLFQMDIKSRDTSVVKHFRSVKPYGIVSNIQRKCDPVVNEVETGNVLLPVGNMTHIENSSSSSEITKSDSSVPMEHAKSSDELELCGDWESIPCLNGASCLSYNRKIFCLCTPGFTGPTCQDEYFKEKRLFGTVPGTIIGALSLIIAVLSLVLIKCAIKNRKLSKGPKIKRQIFVSTSRQRDQTTSSVCEMMDVENCCNMNVCETPCYERMGSASAGPKIDKKAAKSEDKQRLIDS